MKLPTFLRAIAIASAVLATAGCLAQHANSPDIASRLGAISATIYAAGDIADCRKTTPDESGAGKTARIVAAGLEQDPKAAVLTVGDNTYPNGLIGEFTDCYDPTWGRFRDRTWPAPGNHEFRSPAAVGYFSYFGDRAGPNRRGYYSFDLDKWHIVSLNSNVQPADMRAQIAWLKADLAAHPARCTLAYWHHPLFSSGGHGNNGAMKDLWQTLEAAGADVVLAGHDHDYERFAPQNADGARDEAHGMREFIVGTGGAYLTPLGWTKTNSEVGNNTTHGVLRMTLHDNGYEWEFLPVDKGAFTDRGMALCH